MRKISPASRTIATLFVLSGVCLASSSQAQQGLCFHKVRHVTCHFPDGKTIEYETDANAEFYNIPPYMTFRTADRAVHNIIGNCEIVCQP